MKQIYQKESFHSRIWQYCLQSIHFSHCTLLFK